MHNRWLVIAIAMLTTLLLPFQAGPGGPVASAQLIGTFGATRAPMLAVDQADRVYLALSVATSPTGGPHSQIFFTKSVDGGVNWDNLPRTLNLSRSSGEAFGPSIGVTRVGKVRTYITYHDDSVGSTQAIFIRSKKRTNFKSPVDISPGFSGAFTPRVAVDSAGTVNVVWGDTAGGGRRVAFVRSTDLGVTFGNVKIISDSPVFAFDPEIAIDAEDAINVVWEDTGPGVSVIMFVRSTDGGQTFSSPRQISEGDAAATAPHLAIDRDGGINVVWVEEEAGQRQLAFTRSSDAGASFTAPVRITAVAGADMRRPVIATFRQRISIAFQNSDPESRQVFLLTSEDLGRTFPNFVQVSDASRRRGEAHSPTIAFDGKGQLHVAWIDSSILGSDEGILIYTRSEDGRRFVAHRMILAAL